MNAYYTKQGSRGRATIYWMSRRHPYQKWNHDNQRTPEGFVGPGANAPVDGPTRTHIQMGPDFYRHLADARSAAIRPEPAVCFDNLAAALRMLASRGCAPEQLHDNIDFWSKSHAPSLGVFPGKEIVERIDDCKRRLARGHHHQAAISIGQIRVDLSMAVEDHANRLAAQQEALEAEDGRIRRRKRIAEGLWRASQAPPPKCRSDVLRLRRAWRESEPLMDERVQADLYRQYVEALNAALAVGWPQTVGEPNDLQG